MIDSGLGDPGGWLPTDKHTLNVDGPRPDLRAGRRHQSADLEVRIHRALRGAGDREPHRVPGQGWTNPKENYGGRVMCFLETGDGKATSLRFDYEHPPVPPQPNRAWHVAKWLFNRLYWETVPQGRIPEHAPFTSPEGGPIMSDTIVKTLDLKGLSCPMPIAKTAQAIRDAAARRAARVPGHRSRIRSRLQGLVHHRPATNSSSRPRTAGVYRFVIRKKGMSPMTATTGNARGHRSRRDRAPAPQEAGDHGVERRPGQDLAHVHPGHHRCRDGHGDDHLLHVLGTVPARAQRRAHHGRELDAEDDVDDEPGRHRPPRACRR